jgi:selenophosphate synthase
VGGHTGEGKELALGHLVEMTKPSDVDAELWLHALPVLPGADACVAELKAQGYAHTAVIGRVMVQVDAVERVGLVG